MRKFENDGRCAIQKCGNLIMMGDAQSKIENPKSKIEKCGNLKMLISAFFTIACCLLPVAFWARSSL